MSGDNRDDYVPRVSRGMAPDSVTQDDVRIQYDFWNRGSRRSGNAAGDVHVNTLHADQPEGQDHLAYHNLQDPSHVAANFTTEDGVGVAYASNVEGFTRTITGATNTDTLFDREEYTIEMDTRTREVLSVTHRHGFSVDRLTPDDAEFVRTVREAQSQIRQSATAIAEDSQYDALRAAAALHGVTHTIHDYRLDPDEVATHGVRINETILARGGRGD